MTVGDVNSTARGSGARFNDGKPPLDLIPLRIVAGAWRRAGRAGPALHALELLADWQEGDSEERLYAALRVLGNPFHEAARVLEYGKRKYAAWNWSKGMAWSVCLGCAARHLEQILGGEELDGESGLLHVGHVGCNLIFLLQFHRTYPEGDDRPTTLRP